MQELKKRLGQLGVWSPQLQWLPAARAQEAVAAIEDMGYGSVWVGEATGKEVITHATLLLAGSRHLVVGTGIASIWARDPMAMANAGRTLAEAFPGRFVLGLGVSHPFLTTPRDRVYKSPLTTMREYLGALDEAPYAGPPVDPPPRVLAALGPKMLELARDRAAGAHPYFVTVEHTAGARSILGDGPLLIPEQAVVVNPDASAARQLARKYTGRYLALDNYARNLTRLGWGEEEMAGGGSDRLVDALVAWGPANVVAGRLREHLDAGADHVAVRVLLDDPKSLPLHELEQLWQAAGQAT